MEQKYAYISVKKPDSRRYYADIIDYGTKPPYKCYRVGLWAKDARNAYVTTQKWLERAKNRQLLSYQATILEIKQSKI